MVTTKALGLWLFVVGLVWLFGSVLMESAMGSIAESVVRPLVAGAHFGGISFLIIGSAMLMVVWRARLASILVLLGCAWLTWEIAPACVSAIFYVRQPLEAPKPYTFLYASLLLVVLADVAAIVAFRRVRKTI